MITLGIETSCDETSCAVLENADKIRSNIVASSLTKHKPFGGVVPEIASRHCLEAIHWVYEAALKEAKVKPSELGLIAVTQGPGLVGSLLVGLSFAKALAFALGKPFVGIQHLEAHLEANFILRQKSRKPYIGLIVSGGHTSIVRQQHGRFQELGSTADDAVGEAYDKVAKILELGYPGGPVIDRLAQKGNPNAFSFTKPKIDGAFSFSFSGIKTAILHLVRGHGKSALLSSKWRGTQLENLCASFQKTVVDWLVEKTMLACEAKKIKTIVVGGGVSANSRLRAVLMEEAKLRGYDLYIPPLYLTTDNALMVARLGYERYRKNGGASWELTSDPNLAFCESGTQH